MGFFDRVKDVLTTSDAERAKKGRGTAGGTTGAAGSADGGATADATGTAQTTTVQPTTADAPSGEGAQTAPQASTSRPVPAVHPTHTVARGDTLAAIAEQHGVDRGTLAELNHLDNPDLIYPGQVLRLPDA